VLAVVGARGAGKTTLIERLIPVLRRRGFTIAVVKHHAHLDLSEGDQTDTARLARAGAAETVLAGPGGVVHRYASHDEPQVNRVLAQVGPADFILVEGYSQSSLPKILVKRRGVETDRQPPAGPIVAVMTDAPIFKVETDDGVPRFGWDDLGALAELVEGRGAGQRGAPPSAGFS
jgi:molybdopterin-guanine dinucleotide biosynthesis protein MobB